MFPVRRTPGAHRPRPFPKIRTSEIDPLEPRRLMAVTYTLVDLGSLGGGHSEAFDVNDGNQVVGFALDETGAQRAFLFSDVNGNGVADAGEMTNLGTLPGDAASYAYGISDSGVVVGTSRSVPVGTDGNERAVRFNPGAAPTDLGLGAGSNGYSSNATDANDAGQIVGGALSGLNYRPFVRSSTGAVATFTLPAPFNTYGEARGINRSGVVVGYSGGFAGDSAFVRTAGGTLTPVGHPGAALPYSYAWDVSDTGFVAGEGFNSAGDYRAFRYDIGTDEVVDLGTLDGFGSSEAYGVNDAGVTVGRAEQVEGTAGPTHAFVYSDGVLRDLNDLIAPDSGWVLTEARAINDGGAIAGFGTAPDGAERGFLLLPAPPAHIAGRYTFYNDSAFDARDPAANAHDDAAIAPDKEPLLPGQSATFANVTSYVRGINGVIIDMAGLGGDVTVDDFAFRVGNVNTFSDWTAGPAPTISVRLGAGADGSDRVTLTWPDGEIRNQWLEITVLPTPATGLAAPDRFYFGNSVGETGDAGRTEDTLTVNAFDLVATRREMGTASAPLTNRFDFNRDGRVNALDLAAVRSNAGFSLVLITPPPPINAAALPSDLSDLLR